MCSPHQDVILGTRISLPSAGSQASHGKNPNDLRWHQKKFLVGYSSLERRKTYLTGRRHRAKERLWRGGRQRCPPAFIQTLWGRYSPGRCSVRPATPVSMQLGLVGKHLRLGPPLRPHNEHPLSSRASSSPHDTHLSPVSHRTGHSRFYAAPSMAPKVPTTHFSDISRREHRYRASRCPCSPLYPKDICTFCFNFQSLT